jgi:hypothetical protein
MSKKCISTMVLFSFVHYLVKGYVKTTMVQQEKLSVKSTECCFYAVNNKQLYIFLGENE